MKYDVFSTEFMMSSRISPVHPSTKCSKEKYKSSSGKKQNNDKNEEEIFQPSCCAASSGSHKLDIRI